MFGVGGGDKIVGSRLAPQTDGVGEGELEPVNVEWQNHRRQLFRPVLSSAIACSIPRKCEEPAPRMVVQMRMAVMEELAEEGERERDESGRDADSERKGVGGIHRACASTARESRGSKISGRARDRGSAQLAAGFDRP